MAARSRNISTCSTHRPKLFATTWNSGITSPITISWQVGSPDVDIFPFHVMTSWHGNCFSITGPLCGESTGHRWNPLASGPVMRSLMFLLLVWTSCWTNNWGFDDMRCHFAYVTSQQWVMVIWIDRGSQPVVAVGQRPLADAARELGSSGRTAGIECALYLQGESQGQGHRYTERPRGKVT